MFNIGMTELIIIAIIGILVIGPEELPKLARKLAQMLNEFKRVTEDVISPVDKIKEEARLALEKSRQQLVAEIINKKLYEPGEAKLSPSDVSAAKPTTPSEQQSETNSKKDS